MNPSTSRLQGERTTVVLSDQKERIAVLQTPFNYDYQNITTGSTGKWNKTYTFVNSIKVDHKLYQEL